LSQRPQRGSAAGGREADAESPDLLGRRLSTAIVLFHAAVAEELGLNLTDYKCLELLMRRGPANPGQLSADAGLSTATTTLVLDRLERKGLLRREPDPDDRRKSVVRVHLTADITRRFDRATSAMRARMQAIVDSFSDAETDIIRRYLGATTKAIEESVRELKSGG
jgi:DNA-binding MarR family transcriptional regulator